jgi:RHS repeat-associated protein
MVATIQESGQGKRGGRQVRRWTYNELGWLVSMEQPESGRTDYSEFTVTGEPQKINHAGRVVRRTFDPLMRLLKAVSEDGTVDQEFRYDHPAGNRGAALGTCWYQRDRGIELFSSYEAPGGRQSSLEHRIWPGTLPGQGTPFNFKQTFEYDASGNRTLATAGTSRIATQIDSATGQAIALEHDGQWVVRASLDPVSWNVASLDYRNGVSTTITYGPDQERLAKLSHQSPGQAKAQWDYRYDEGGRLVSTGEDHYRYDPLNRLVEARVKRLDGIGTVLQKFSYDALGNTVASLTTGDLPPADTRRSHINNFVFNLDEKAAMATSNQIPRSASGIPTGAGYDPQGNLVQIWRRAGDARSLVTLTYDALGRVTEAWNANTGRHECYAYDARGLRTLVVARKGDHVLKRTVLIRDDQRRLVTRLEDGSSRGMGTGFGSGLGDGALAANRAIDLLHLGHLEVAEREAGLMQFKQLDHLGSPRIITNAEGKVVARIKHLPFGESLDVSGPRSLTGYTGHDRAGSNGFISMQVRYYSPQYHRFLSPDPGWTPDFFNPQSWNRYLYTENLPTMRVDPDGMMFGAPGGFGGRSFGSSNGSVVSSINASISSAVGPGAVSSIGGGTSQGGPGGGGSTGGGTGIRSSGSSTFGSGSDSTPGSGSTGGPFGTIMPLGPSSGVPPLTPTSYHFIAPGSVLGNAMTGSANFMNGDRSTTPASVTYSQSTGTYHLQSKTLGFPSDRNLGPGWAGRGRGKNNPSMDHVKDTGPLPKGKYYIGQPENRPKSTGAYSLPLKPVPGTQMHNRSDFLIHGPSQNPARHGQESHGCPILDRAGREAIHNSGASVLTVVPSLTVPGPGLERK